MCKFCENLNYKNNNELIWNVRSVFAEDNVTEYFEELNDFNYVENYCNFTIKGYEHDGNISVYIEYDQTLQGKKFGEIKIHPFSESIQFNYCPMCGKQISETIKEFTGYGYGIHLEEENG